MTLIIYDWELEVEHGPNWLFVKVAEPLGDPWEMPPLVDTVRSLMEEHFTSRLVLELDEIRMLSNELIGQLVVLNKWILARQGVMRICGLSSHSWEVLRHRRLDTFFHVHRDRLEAVMGRPNPSHPR